MVVESANQDLFLPILQSNACPSFLPSLLKSSPDRNHRDGEIRTVDWFGLASGRQGGFLPKLADLVGGGLLVGLGRSVVLVLLGLVPDGVASGLEAVGRC